MKRFLTIFTCIVFFVSILEASVTGRISISEEIAYQRYNRTWETYTYQTSMTRAVDSIIENELQFFIKECKRKYNIKRLTKEKREQAENQFYKVPYIVELLNIKEELKHRA